MSQFTVAGGVDGVSVSGVVIFQKGHGSRQGALLEGSAFFDHHMSKHEVSSVGVLEKIQSGEIKTSEVNWKLNYGQLIGGYFAILIIALLFSWLFKWKQESESQKDSESRAQS